MACGWSSSLCLLTWFSFHVCPFPNLLCLYMLQSQGPCAQHIKYLIFNRLQFGRRKGFIYQNGTVMKRREISSLLKFIFSNSPQIRAAFMSREGRMSGARGEIQGKAGNLQISLFPVGQTRSYSSVR